MLTNRDLIKSDIQDRAVSLLDKNQYIALEWATGCGKTLATLKMIEKIQLNYPQGKGLIVFKESTHKKNWLEDCNKHGMNHVLNNVETVLYASLHKVKEQYYDYIVLDECHAITWNRLNKLKLVIIPTTQLIFLSATIPNDKKYLLSMLIDNRVIRYATISLQKAIDMNIVPKPTIFVHKIKIKGLAKVKYDNIEKQIMYFRRKNNYDALKSFGLKRKNLIASYKDGVSKNIISQFKKDKKRFICFAANIEQGIVLSRGRIALVSSKAKDKKQNQILVDNFNSKRIDALMAIKMLREGLNLTDIDAGIIIQLDKEPLAFYQMLGRCLRSENPEMHIILCEGTNDDVYFNNVMDKTLLKYVKYV